MGDFVQRQSFMGGKRNSISGGSGVRSACHFQLDQCLGAKAMDKLIYQMTSTAETRQKSKMHSHSKMNQKKSLDYDIEGFSEFLATAKALPVLLFWKDAEDFSTLFGQQEKQKTAEKIFERYLEPGAEYEITSMQDDRTKLLKLKTDNPPDDLFEELQTEAYNMMLFELFPAFFDAVKKEDQQGESAAARSKITAGTTLDSVLKANDLEIHLFAEYCREHMCEESVTFLLECNMFSLLFDPLDLEQQAQRIFKLYIDEESEGRIAGISGATTKDLKMVLEAAEVLNMKKINKKEQGRAARRSSEATGVTPQLFDKVRSEVLGTLNMDVWPRYKEAVLAGTALTLSGVGDTEAEDLEMRRPSKQAVMKALKNATQLEHLRTAAAKQGMTESVDFCASVLSYKLLFSSADRRPRAEGLWKTYVMPGSDLPVNLPDTMTKNIEKRYEEAPPDLFDESLDELLQVISDNIFDRYLQEADKEKAAKEAAAKAAANDKKAAAPPNSGGCCTVM